MECSLYSQSEMMMNSHAKMLQQCKGLGELPTGHHELNKQPETHCGRMYSKNNFENLPVGIIKTWYQSVRKKRKENCITEGLTYQEWV